MKRLLLLLVVACAAIVNVSAYSFEVDGIYYNSIGNQCVSVTYDVDINNNHVYSYSGDVVIPKEVVYNNTTYRVTQIGSDAFYGCSSLSSVVIPEGVTQIGSYAFYGCSSLNSVVIPDGVTQIGGDAFSGCSSLSSVVIPEGVTQIGSYAFYGCSSLNSVVIPDGVTQIGNGAFQDCSSLITFKSKIPAERMNGSTSVLGSSTAIVPAEALNAYRTAWQSEETQIIADNAQTDWDVTVTAADNSSAIHTAIMADKDADMLAVLHLKVAGTINSYDFMVMRNKMLNLRTVDLSEAHVVYNPYQHYQGYHSENNILPGYAFYSRPRLVSCILPQDITSIGSSTFESTGLSEITMPNTVKTIGGDAFKYCRNLQTVNFSDSLESIGNFAFNSCYQLNEVKFPVSLKRIEYYAFYGTNLKEVRLPAAVEYVANDAFNTSTIKDVYTYIVEPVNIGQTTFAESTFLNATLHVQATAFNNYYWDTQWSQFQSMVEFNEPYEYFYLNKDLEIGGGVPPIDGVPDEDGNVTGPDADLNPGSGLIVDEDANQDLGDVNLKDDGNGNSGSIIGNGDGNGNIHAKNLHIEIGVEANRWYFFTFPFNILKDQNIKYKGSYVLRYYDGAERAENGSGGWKDVTDQYLYAGMGYIFQGSTTGTLTLQVPDAMFNGADKETVLIKHESDQD